MYAKLNEASVAYNAQEVWTYFPTVASMKYSQKVHLSEDVVLPPRCQVILPGFTTQLVTTRTQFLFEPDEPKLKLGVFAIQTLLYPSKTFTVPLRLLNTGLAPVKLCKGTTLGHLEPDVIQVPKCSSPPVANVWINTVAEGPAQ
ncbi:hypothetical protein, partial [Pseudoalteromonas sp.]|uniref:hypothetical protein n=1 Tax=Pseudoalteromonas sp. TaxID=53249 RepID=UPI0026151A91